MVKLYWRRFTRYLNVLRIKLLLGFMKAFDKSGRYRAEIEHAENVLEQRKKLLRRKR